MKPTNKNLSQSTVLGDDKLLIHILSYLGIRDLLTSATRVNRAWKQLIDSTPSLQEALFFRFPPFTASRLLNPLLRDLWPLWFVSPSAFNRQRPQPTASDFLLLEWAERPAAFQRKEASWRKMLIVSGGTEVTALKVVEHVQSMLGFSETHGTIMCPDGVCMGVLWDLTMNWCKRDQYASFVVRWPEELTSDGKENTTAVALPRESRWRKSLKRVLGLWRWMTRRSDDIGAPHVSSLTGKGYAESDASSEMAEDGFVTLDMSISISCQPAECPALGSEFQSEAYEKVTILYEPAL